MEFSSCSEDCGGGKKTKVEYCDSPEPLNGGANCSCPVGDSTTLITCDGLMATIEETCNEDPCPGKKCVCLAYYACICISEIMLRFQ